MTAAAAAVILFFIFCWCLHKSKCFSTKSLVFLRATKNLKFVCSLLSQKCKFMQKCQKSKVQTPFALKNAKFVNLCTKAL